MNAVAENAMEQLSQSGVGTVALLSTVIVLGAAFVAKKYVLHKQEGAHTEGKAPPYIPSTIPFLGQAVEFNKDPIGFLTTSYKQYGPVFSFSMVGKTFTYLVGSDAAAKFFESRNEDLNAEEVYQKLVTPVFGKGVAYDVPHHIFLEQKKMFKSGLNIARFTMYIPMIEEETNAYFDHNWGDSGQKDIFVALSELIILTASRCLHGKEIRSILNAEVAQLYTDLDGGFTPMAWLLPAWVPLPSFRKRDKAHIEMKKIFYEAIRKRKESGDEEEDMLQTLIETKYRSGRHMTDDEIAGMLIGLLMAGQHTSSTTTAWLSFFLAKHKDIQEACYEEQLRVSGSSLAPLNYASLKECTLLERCVKEALRLRPPLMTVMRMCKTPLNVCGYTVPVGHQVCVSPPTNQMLDDVWTNAQEFYPDRFLEDKGATSSEKFSYVPFGAGRHRCIGESFAYIQVKTIVATLLRKYELELVDNYFPTVNTKTMIHTPTDPVIRYKPRVSTN